MMHAFILICLAGTSIYVHANSERQLNGKTAVVTGAGKGIGYAIADNLLNEGVQTMIIVDKNRPLGLKAEKELNCKHGANRTMFFHGDITKDLDRVSKRIFQTIEYVDILVNNAGILNEYDPKKTMETNAVGTVLWAHRFYDCMRKDRGGKGGTIMNTASISAYMSDPFMWSYKASKFAVLGFTLGLGHKYNYLSSGVRVIAMCPALTYTDMTLKQQITVDEQARVFKRFIKNAVWQSADDVGKAAVILYKTGSTGTAYTVQGGAAPVVSPDRVSVTVEDLLHL